MAKMYAQISDQQTRVVQLANPLGFDCSNYDNP